MAGDVLYELQKTDWAKCTTGRRTLLRQC